MAPTPVKTPQSKQRLNFSNPKTEHPVEVIGRIRSLPERNFKPSPSPALEISGNGRSLRLRSDSGYRDFILDGVSLSESESLEAFYERFVEPRIAGVRSGGKCTVMMYGPTGAGKSHTMFGSSAEPGIVYRALKGILGEGEGDLGLGIPLFAQVAVLEIYNEEIYDLLLSGNCAQANKGSTPKARLEVMGRKAKNASYICGNEAGKLSREIAKVEKRRIIKNTLLNERSSRSHCVIILDVPSVGGRLMLVDMAGSENIEQAGQAGFEAKIQTAKINQGNIALKRVVESIANGDSHVPFRDSKLTMLLQDSFEDENSKILMILCASPDPKEMHKTIATLEYGAKAKCIVRVAHMPTPRDKLCGEDSSPLLRSRIVAMNQFIYKLQMENKVKDKECDKARRDLLCKEEEILQLRSKIHLIEGRPAAAVKEEEIRCVVDERTRALRIELRKMEEKVHQQQEELYSLRKRLEERESIKCAADDDNEALYLHDGNGGKFLKRLAEICPEDQGMEKSMDLDLGDQEEPETRIHDVREIEKEMQHNSLNSCVQENNICFGMPKFPEKLCLSTVFERDDEGEDRDGMEEEVDKEVVECIEHKFASLSKHQTEDFDMLLGLEDGKDSDSTRRTRIQNIFRLCGNHRELAQHVAVPTPIKRKLEDASFHSLPLSQNKELFVSSSLIPPLPKIPVVDGSQQELKENKEPAGVEPANMMNVYVKWEASKEFSGNMIRKMLVMKSSTLSDLRKLIEIHLEEINNKQPFTFLMLADPLGAPVPVEKEDAILVSKLPACNGQQNTHLACLRPARRSTAQWQNHTPFSSLENTLLPLQEMKTSP